MFFFSSSAVYPFPAVACVQYTGCILECHLSQEDLPNTCQMAQILNTTNKGQKYKKDKVVL